jgi:hypothetical protein
VGGVSYVDRVNYVISLVSLTSLLDRRSEDLGEETTERQDINPLGGNAKNHTFAADL